MIPPPRRVLIVKLSSLGDVVHALPLAEMLRAGLGPDAHIAWAVRERFAELLIGNPHLSAVHVLQKTDGGISGLVRFGAGLRRTARPDVAIDAQGLFVSGMVTALSGAPVRVGFDRNRECNRLFLTRTIPARDRVHIVEKLLRLGDALGVPRLAPRAQTYLANGEPVRARELLQGSDSASGDAPIVGFVVGASTADKMYPAAQWAEAARLLLDQGVRVALLGGPGETLLAEEIARGATSGGGSLRLTNLAGRTTVRELASVFARCAVVVGGDSGPTHLAVAVGTPVVGLYGVTDPARTGTEWGCAPSVILDLAQTDAPPALRRPRHATLSNALARIPPTAIVYAVSEALTHGK